jgi:hypothetical protein
MAPAKPPDLGLPFPWHFLPLPPPYPLLPSCSRPGKLTATKHSTLPSYKVSLQAGNSLIPR